MQIFEIIPSKRIYDDTNCGIINNKNNSRFNIQNILKHNTENINLFYYVLKDTDIGYLAIAGILRNPLNTDITNFTIANFQSLYKGKGYGKKLLDNIIDVFKNIWLMTDPSQDETLIEYYRSNEKLQEFVLENNIYKEKYNKPLYFYYSVNFDKRILKNLFDYIKFMFGTKDLSF